MAVKKSELYSSLWASCDKLRGGMDASQYKDYIMTLLFVKYVSDKFKGVKYADINVPEGGSFDDIALLKGDKNIGEKIDKVIAKLAEAPGNNLRGVIDNAHFNDETKLGKGQEMVDKLTGLVTIFQNPSLNFKNNRTEGDDLIGDAYEYLMRHFATESGKSKGQFYTPAEVSRIIAKIIGIKDITHGEISVYDPACGSGSLLIRAADEAPFDVAIYGQEKDISTAGLAKMNFVLHNKAAGEVMGNYSTFSDPRFFEDAEETILRKFDFVVANPPFSIGNWTDGLKDYGRFDGYDDRPPEKNGDFAWLLHIIKSMKHMGKAAVILPHGVLFRGNAEASIRKNIIDRGYIKGIIGLPANLFYGTGIPACIIVLDKEDAPDRAGIFMIDASQDYVKDGNKNRLRERDIYKIVTTFNNLITDDATYSRFVPMEEIKVKNEYNLNTHRYIDSDDAEDSQCIEAHLQGGIPMSDIDGMSKYWDVFKELKSTLFSTLRDGFYKLNIDKDDVRRIVYADSEFSRYADKIDSAFSLWQVKVNNDLCNINSRIKAKFLIADISEALVAEFENIALIDKHNVYQVLLAFWNDVMADDIHIIIQDGYSAAREIEYDIETIEKGKKAGQERVKGWEGKLIPKNIIIKEYFPKEFTAIIEVEAMANATQNKLDELIEEHTSEGGALFEYLDDNNTLVFKDIEKAAKDLKKAHITSEEAQILYAYIDLTPKIKEYNKLIKQLKTELDEKTIAKYPLLSDNELIELLVNRKWFYTIFNGIEALYKEISNDIANRIAQLAERYENTLPALQNEVSRYASIVQSHLERMGYTW